MTTHIKYDSSIVNNFKEVLSVLIVVISNFNLHGIKCLCKGSQLI